MPNMILAGTSILKENTWALVGAIINVMKAASNLIEKNWIKHGWALVI